VHGQLTFVKQYHPSFTSPYEGPNSLTSGHNGEETTDFTLFAGVRLWNGGAFYVNPEVDEGFGLSNTLGAAGFPSGEAYKVGKSKPYFRLQRAFLRQVFDLEGRQTVDPCVNEVGGVRTVNNVIDSWQGLGRRH
jgi:high affinity Mn2+ porin